MVQTHQSSDGRYYRTPVEQVGFLRVNAVPREGEGSIDQVVMNLESIPSKPQQILGLFVCIAPWGTSSRTSLDPSCNAKIIAMRTDSKSGCHGHVDSREKVDMQSDPWPVPWLSRVDHSWIWVSAVAFAVCINHMD
ncbi:hypothetical protein MITS9509_02736 [Synechococcus sp. MIT S9509]|nr:hypothetical protein MITS9504_02090 [Synechococcus sp. MIT S9504]KZR90447.1 hypothetical protein MITS9509_02736 [Synechococcus sp. MIT S9509]